MDRKAKIVLVVILLIPLIALAITMSQTEKDKVEKLPGADKTYYEAVLPNPLSPGEQIISRNISSESATISLYPAEYRVTMETFVPEATASISVKYKELLKIETDKFGNVYRTYGGHIQNRGDIYQVMCKGKTYKDNPWCWIEDGYTTDYIGAVDRFNNLNTTFTIPENSLNATLLIDASGGTVLVNLYGK